MAKKKNNNTNQNRDTNNENNSNEGDKKKEGGDAEKKNDEKGSVTVVLKLDMHCEGCASKIVKCVRVFEGVETVKPEISANKLTIVGSVDPSKIRDKLSHKTKKKVDLVSPQPKKDKDKETKEENNKNNNVNDKKPKEKEAPVTTAVLKLNLHCQGCIKKIHKTVSKTKGVIEMSVDKQKDLVTVKGTMDMKVLTANLKEKLKRPVEIVPPKKEKEEKESNGGDNNNGSGKKKKGGGDGDGDGRGKGGQEAEGGWKMEGNRMNYMIGVQGAGYGYGYQHPMHGGYEYGNPVGGFHAPQMFSDENPNACSVM